MPIVVQTPVVQPDVTDSTSPDGLIRVRTVPAYAGILITVDYLTLLPDPGFEWTNPLRVDVFRKDDETGEEVLVRGGDSRTRYGGLFDIFDEELSFGRVYTYRAVAYQRDGSVGRASYATAIRSWAPATQIKGVWIKCLNDNTHSQPVRVADWSKHSYSAANNMIELQGSEDMAFAMQPRKRPSSAISVLTSSEDEYMALLGLIKQRSVVYIASLRHDWKRDGYYVLGDAESNRVGNLSYDYDVWTVGLQQVKRTSTKGQNAPQFPWRNLDDRLAQWPTLDAAKAAGLPYRNGVEAFDA